MISARSLRKAVRSNLQQANIPAPVGGLNTVDPGYAMPAGTCPVLYNLIGAENGLRSRLGYREWCTGVGAATVPTIIPFAGSGTNGSKDRLFATSTGTAKIYSVGASSAAPTAVFNFASSAGSAGWGVAHGFVSANAQHFCLLFDEQNGYHVYSETNDTWQVVAQQTSAAWLPAHAYVLNDRVVAGGVSYKCTTGGNSAAAPATGPSGVGTGIADGTAVWAYEPTINGVDPTKFVAGTVWKNFVLFVEKDSSRMWFSSTTNALYGTVTSWDFGSKFKHGGNLVGLWSWTIDGGIGVDDYLVAISSSGDVVVYKGTDPNAASTFAIVGTWFVGGVPAGRRIATDFGGDLLILSNVGVVPLSKLITGTDITDTSQYATRNIGNTFSRAIATYGSSLGWSLHLHPEDASLLITLPFIDAGYPQYAMSVLTRGWSQYRGLPMVSNGAWGRQMYFGTADGRVCVNTGYLDNVNLAATSFTAIDCSLITAFSNNGSVAQKQIKAIRPTVISEGGNVPISVAARYRYDLSEAATPTSNPTNTSSLWDSAVWDTATWGGAYATQQPVYGATGMGPDAAIAFRCSASSRTVLIGFDVAYTEGGML